MSDLRKLRRIRLFRFWTLFLSSFGRHVLSPLSNSFEEIRINLNRLWIGHLFIFKLFYGLLKLGQELVDHVRQSRRLQARHLYSIPSTKQIQIHLMHTRSTFQRRPKQYEMKMSLSLISLLLNCVSKYGVSRLK